MPNTERADKLVISSPGRRGCRPRDRRAGRAGRPADRGRHRNKDGGVAAAAPAGPSARVGSLLEKLRPNPSTINETALPPAARLRTSHAQVLHRFDFDLVRASLLPSSILPLRLGACRADALPVACWMPAPSAPPRWRRRLRGRASFMPVSWNSAQSCERKALALMLSAKNLGSTTVEVVSSRVFPVFGMLMSPLQRRAHRRDRRLAIRA